MLRPGMSLLAKTIRMLTGQEVHEAWLLESRCKYSKMVWLSLPLIPGILANNSTDTDTDSAAQYTMIMVSPTYVAKGQET